MYGLLGASDRSPGASAQAIADVELQLGYRFPADYRAFLGVSDGFNGAVGAHYLVLWPTAELVAMATGYDLLPVGPDQTLIGSNGGPTAFGLVGNRYVSIPFDSGIVDMRVLADSFDGFIAAIAAGEGW